MAQSLDGRSVYAAIAVSCLQPGGGLYLLRKSTSARSFPAVTAREEVLGDPAVASGCDDVHPDGRKTG
jgi:hypothetical protein